MHRHGHIGVSLLVLSPVVALLVFANRGLLAVAFALGVLLIEPLPDYDHGIPALRHRGYSHSVVASLLVGGVVAGIAFGLGAVTSDVHAVAPLHLAAFGAVVGATGVGVHLLGDALTVGGIRPYRPLSRHQVSLTDVRATSVLANEGLLLAGSAAMATAVGVGVVAGG